MGQFTEQILFPRQLDTFPSLSDSTFGAIHEDQIVYAEHYNKVANLIEVVETSLGRTASSDGTIRGIAFNFSILVTIGHLFGLVAPNAYNSSTVLLPDNMLPFEFVFANNSDDYSNWKLTTTGEKLWFQSADTTTFKSTVGGLDFFNIYPMVTSSVIAADNVAVWPITHIPVNSYIVNSYAVMGTDTMVVRGVIIDTTISNPATFPNKWSTVGGSVFLRCTIAGVKV